MGGHRWNRPEGRGVGGEPLTADPTLPYPPDASHPVHARIRKMGSPGGQGPEIFFACGAL